jgi:dsDNA-specific endonuclease/ATPase MutS2
VEEKNELSGVEEIETFSTVAFEIGDVLDLHSFPPSEIGELVRDYLDLAYARGLRRLRIIHGKGVGVQKERVRKILEKDPRVIGYGDPPGEAGGWGATVVEMG